MTLYEYLSMHDDAELEVGDNTWDYTTNVYWDNVYRAADEGNTCDFYYKFCIAFYRQCNIVKLHDQKSATIDVTGVVRKFKEQLTKVMQARWLVQYEGDDFEEMWVRELCLYINGEITQSISERLCSIFNEERNRWLEAHNMEGENE